MYWLNVIKLHAHDEIAMIYGSPPEQFLQNMAISKFVTRSPTAIREWIQKYNPKRLFYRKTKIFEFILD